jgi:hypothetical protein
LERALQHRSIMPKYLALLLAACATAPPPPVATPAGGPRGLRASEHLDLARQHDQIARARTGVPESYFPGPPRDLPLPMPWFRSWDTTADHERIAAIHRGHAAALETEYEEACGNRAAEDVAVSPLVRFGVGGWPTTTGVIVYLSPKAGTADALMAALRCHRAFMMLALTDMDDCPLDLPGLQLDVRGDADGITVAMTVKDGKLVPELQRRVAHDLEAGQRAKRAP